MNSNCNGALNKTPSESHTKKPKEKELPNGSQYKAKDKWVTPKQINCSPTTSRYGRAIKFMSSTPNKIIPTKIMTTPKSKNSSITENGNESIIDSNDCTIESNSELETSSNLKDVSIADDTSIIEEKLRTFTVGELAWARIGSYPHWPCVVTLDPETNVHHMVKSTNIKILNMIHVHYFGDNGRHGWASLNQMLPFRGKEEVLQAIAELKLKSKKSLFNISWKSKTIKKKWEIAIEEASNLLNCTHKERIDVYKPKPKIKNFILEPLTYDENEIKGKRKNSSKEDEPIIKKTKQDLNDSNHQQLKVAKTPVKNGLKQTKVNTEKDLNKKKRKSEQSSDSEKDKSADDKNKNLNESKTSETELKANLSKSMNGTSPVQKKSVKLSKQKVEEQSKESSSSSEAESTDIESVKETRKQKAEKSRSEKDENTMPENNKKLKLYNPFKGIKQNRVCQICEKTGELIRCKGPCYSYFHLSCVRPDESSSDNSAQEEIVENGIMEDLKIIKEKLAEDEESDCNDSRVDGKDEDELFRCIDCLSGVAPACFVCNEREEDRIRCSGSACGKHYHSACLKLWPQAHWQGGRLTCPYHVCHTCSSDNPQKSHSLRSTYEKLVRCVRCPSSYHPSISCLPAGSSILTGNQIICPKHYKATHPPVNATWCFLCTKGGSLICCDTCPMSFHADCLSIKAPDGAYICEDCETGRLPLYGEIVWVKLGSYRWWPSCVCYPNEIPQNIASLSHSPGEFCIMFLGTNNYYWVHRGRVFLYQDGDANTKVSNAKKGMEEAYKKALMVAHKMHQEFKEKRDKMKDLEPHRSLKPPHYVKLKINKPVGNVKAVEVDSIVACQCTPKMEKPCAPDVNCLNRMLLVECSQDICPAGAKCNNQDFVLRRYPRMEPFHTDGRGWGLRALEGIRSGQFVIEYVGEIIDEAEYKRRLQRKKEVKNENYYFLTIDQNRMIDAEPKGNLSRFMNHSCQPNCETQKWTVNGDTRIGLFALRDIEIGEELTFNYHLQCDGEWRKPCLCGAPNCSGFIGGKSGRPSVNAILPKKIEKTEKLKKNHKKQKKTYTKHCYLCGKKLINSDDVINCGLKTCNKKYHRSCITVDETIKFKCPWHFCNICKRKSSLGCSLCCNSFCQAHSEGNLTELKEKGKVVCNDHDKTPEVNNGKEETDNDTSRTDSLDERDNSMSRLVVEELSITNGSSRGRKRKFKQNEIEIPTSKTAKRHENPLNSQKKLRILESDFEVFYEKITKLYYESDIRIKREPDFSNDDIKKGMIFKNSTSDEDVKNILQNSTNKKELTEMRSIETNQLMKLFKSVVKQEKNCQICGNSEQTIICNGPCSSYFHLSCVNTGDLNKGKIITDESFICTSCSSEIVSKCFVCNKNEGFRTKCSVSDCDKQYHSNCLKAWPQSIWKHNLVCPCHICHTCSSESLRNGDSLRTIHKNVVTCIRCPTAYHFEVHCIPIGSTILSSRKIICLKHHKVDRPWKNINWCFVCSQDASDISCTGCPASFHIKCLEIKNSKSYTCKDCETGRLPLYGEVVWVNMENCRGWPSVICFPHEIPLKTMVMPHEPDEFCVLFLGTINYAWIHRRRIFIYHGSQDNAKFSCGMEFTAGVYDKALDDASKLYLKYSLLRGHN